MSCVRGGLWEDGKVSVLVSSASKRAQLPMTLQNWMMFSRQGADAKARTARVGNAAAF